MKRRLPNSFGTYELSLVWRDSSDGKRRRSGAPGVDGLTAAEFGAHLPSNIAQIRRELQTAQFRFEKLRAAPVPKAAGGHRIIAVPTVRDRFVQRAVLRHLENDRRFDAGSSISFGFSRGSTLAAAQTRARDLRNENAWVVQSDIIKFFDNIDRKQIIDLVERRVRGRTVQEILRSAIECELEDRGSLGKIIRESGIVKGRGLRQGMPLSPVLSNLLLKGFDDALTKRGIPAVRYADDFILFAAGKSECLEALDFVRSELERLGLAIPELGQDAKTKILGPERPVTFLGIDLKRYGNEYRLEAPFRKLAQVEADMRTFASVASCLENQRDIPGLLRFLDSFVVGHHASMRVAHNANEYLARLRAMKQASVRALLQEMFGSSIVEGLTQEALAVLGLVDFPAKGRLLPRRKRR